MTGIVVDCSAVVNALTVRDGLASSGQLSRNRLHAPHLIDFEVVSALRRLSRGALAPNLSREALELWRELDVSRHPARAIVPRMWELRHDFSAYDAAYVALAEALDAPLLTADRRMARSAARYCDVIS